MTQTKYKATEWINTTHIHPALLPLKEGNVICRRVTFPHIKGKS